MSEHGLYWKPLDWGEECPKCGAGAEVLTRDRRDDYARDGDKARCQECHHTGMASCDESGAWIMWQDLGEGDER
jgi:hypothetical protein